MILNVTGLGFSYNGRRLLDGIGFSVHRGEMLVVVGINGVGKTTLLKCLCGILTPDRGNILLEGKQISRMSRIEVARRIGYVPQRYSDTDMSVFDAVLLGRKPHIGWAIAEKDLKITEDILAMLNLESMALRPISSLSGGEIQKVMIGRSLAQSPELLLLDEPTSNLDLRNQIEIMDILAGVVKQKDLAIIVTMHDINTALRFADRFLMLKDGCIHSMTPRESITEELIRRVFDVDVVMGTVGDYQVVIPAKPVQ